MLEMRIAPTLSISSHAIPADSRVAAKVWDDALGYVIGAGKKPAKAGTTANYCTEGPDLNICRKQKEGMAGTTGLEPSTSDVTGRRPLY